MADWADVQLFGLPGSKLAELLCWMSAQMAGQSGGPTEMPWRRFARGSLLSGNTSDDAQPEGIVSGSHETSDVHNGPL